MNPLNTSWRRARTAADVPSYNLGNPDVKALAGPAETDQIGKSVADSAAKGMEDTPGPRNILSKGDPSFTPGALPPIPWPVAPIAESKDDGSGTHAAATPAPVENKEIVVIKQRNPDGKIPTTQDVANAVAKADKSMADALKVTSKDDPLNDPAFAADRAVSTARTESAVAGPAEMAKAAKVANKEAVEEAAKVVVMEKKITEEKAKEDAAEQKAAKERKAEDTVKEEEKKAEKKKEDVKVEKEAEAKAKVDEKRTADNAVADAAIEKKNAAADAEAARETAKTEGPKPKESPINDFAKANAEAF